jgi:UDP-N-acetylmuramoyl-tripeptide--D-alanyl-D-alanine ligase
VKLSLADMQSYLPGCTVHRFDPQLTIDGVVTDSRKVTPGCLFVALIGEKFDAHEFLADVVRLGAGALVVNRVPAGLSLPAFVVADTRVALGQIANGWRSRFHLPLIGVTGSNGKTTVKEMIASILRAAQGEAGALSTLGNLNNEIGVPLTLFRLNEQHRAAVIELGMNHPGEIAMLGAIAQPSVALINNAQREHQEFMQSVEAVALEHGALISGLSEDGIAVFPAGDEYSGLWHKLAAGRKVLTFGLEDNPGPVDVAGQFVSTDFGNQLTIYMGRDIAHVELKAAGVHNVLNALASAAACHAIGCSKEAIIEGLQDFSPVSGRLQNKRAHNQALVIDDTYNANPDSVRAAIRVLAQASGEKILVLGDMGEVGDNGPAFHAEVGTYAKQQGVDRLLTLGSLARHSSDAFGSAAAHFDQIEALLKDLDLCLQKTSTVLVKGSRFMKMERIVSHLVQQVNK